MAPICAPHDNFKEQLVTTIGELCLNHLHFNSSLHIQGLLGVTLDDNEVVLVNIDKIVTQQTLKETSPQAQLESTSLSQMVSEGQQTSDSTLLVQSNATSTDILKRPLVPMHSFKSPFKRQKVLRHKHHPDFDERTRPALTRAVGYMEEADVQHQDPPQWLTASVVCSSDATKVRGGQGRGCCLPAAALISPCHKKPDALGPDDSVAYDLTLPQLKLSPKPPLQPLFSPNVLSVKVESDPQCEVEESSKHYPCEEEEEEGACEEQEEALNLIKPKRVRFVDESRRESCYSEGTTCHLCGQVMSSVRNLEHHLQRHQGVYPYKCPYCTRGFSSSTNLKGHLWKHTNVKDFRCHVCSAEFIYKINLKRHMRKKHPETAITSSPVTKHIFR